MLRFFDNLFRCKVCDAYKEQLEYERAVNKELLDTILLAVRPPKVSLPEKPALLPAKQFVSWSRRRSDLEEQERAKARKPENLKNLEAKPKSTESLEKELGILENSNAS